MMGFRDHLPPEDPPFLSKTSMLQVAYGTWANLVVVITGMSFGFTAVAIPQLKKDSSIVLTEDDIAWFASLLSLTSIGGSLISGYMLDVFGRKWALILNVVPYMIAWILIGTAVSNYALILGQASAGVAAGISFSSARIYSTEISLPNMRGVLSSFMSLSLSFGIISQAMLTFACGWRTLSHVNEGFTVFVWIMNLFLPDTPYYLLMKHEDLKYAKRSLKHFRSKTYDIDAEMDMLQNYKTGNNIVRLSCWETITALMKPSSCKPFLLIMVFAIFVHLGGMLVSTFWLVEVLAESKTSVDKYHGNAIISYCRLLGGIVYAITIYKLRRRTMAIISGAGMGVSYIALGSYVLYAPEPTVFPFLFNVAYVMFLTFGFQSIPYLLMSEIYPLQVRGVLSGISLAFISFLAFVVIKMYPNMINSFGFPSTMFIYSGFALSGSIFIYFFIPETKDLTLQEIEEFYNKRRSTLVSSRNLVPSPRESMLRRASNLVSIPDIVRRHYV